MARRHLLSGGSHINLSPENDDNALGSACPILLLYIMYVSFILFRTHQQRWQIGNYSLRQWTLISPTAVYCWDEVCLSVKVTCLCVLFNSSCTVVELCGRFLWQTFGGLLCCVACLIKVIWIYGFNWSTAKLQEAGLERGRGMFCWSLICGYVGSWMTSREAHLQRSSDPAVPPAEAGELSCDKDKHEFNGNGYQHNPQTAVGLLLVLFGRTFASSEQSSYCLHPQVMHVKDQAT